jgi:hypothetical protein
VRRGCMLASSPLRRRRTLNALRGATTVWLARAWRSRGRVGTGWTDKAGRAAGKAWAQRPHRKCSSCFDEPPPKAANCTTNLRIAGRRAR